MLVENNNILPKLKDVPNMKNVKMCKLKLNNVMTWPKKSELTTHSKNGAT
jgi:hypothetical protein